MSEGNKILAGLYEAREYIRDSKSTTMSKAMDGITAAILHIRYQESKEFEITEGSNANNARTNNQ